MQQRVTHAQRLGHKFRFQHPIQIYKARGLFWGGRHTDCLILAHSITAKHRCFDAKKATQNEHKIGSALMIYSSHVMTLSNYIMLTLFDLGVTL